jgi:hypothetical protein
MTDSQKSGIAQIWPCRCTAAAAEQCRPVGDVKTRSKVGFLPEHFRFYDWLTSAELLKLHGRLYRLREKREDLGS